MAPGKKRIRPSLSAIARRRAGLWNTGDSRGAPPGSDQFLDGRDGQSRWRLLRPSRRRLRLPGLRFGSLPLRPCGRLRALPFLFLASRPLFRLGPFPRCLALRLQEAIKCHLAPEPLFSQARSPAASPRDDARARMPVATGSSSAAPRRIRPTDPQGRPNRASGPLAPPSGQSLVARLVGN
jgi:hypothetical protein